MANIFTDITDFLSGGDTGVARDFFTEAGKDIKNVQAPNLSALIPQLKLQVQQGLMTPAEATAYLQEASAMQNVQTDQGSLAGQRTALDQLANIAANKGMTEADRAMLNATMNQTNANAAQQRAAQLQQLQMQGNAGTGAELAARLSGVQSGANANAMAGANMAQSAQARALQAIQAGLQGNANLNTQQFNQQAQKAQAQDTINQFNAQARNAMAQGNAQMANSANLANFNMANNINANNTEIQNKQAMMPLSAAQQQYTNSLDKAKASSAAQLGAGKNLVELGKAQAANSAGLLDFAGNLLNGGTGGFGGLVKNASGKLGSWVEGVFKEASPSVIKDIISTTTKPAAGTSGTQGNNISSFVPAGYNALGEWIGNGDWGNSGSIIADAAADTINAGNFGSTVDFGSDLSDLGNLTNTVSDSGSWLSDLGNSVMDWFSDENMKTGKKELTDSDVDKMMASMTGYKYRYKGKGNPEVAGVMAQDLEKGGSDSVINTANGKMIQGQPMLGEALAMLANQHDRIKKLEGRNNG